MDRALTEAERYPLLDEPGRELLRRLHEHPRAPKFNHGCGDRLSAEGLERVRRFEQVMTQGQGPGWGPDREPPWLAPFVRRCSTDVPFYQRWRAAGRLEDLPTCGREDLAREPWSFVPYTEPLDDLILYDTTGTTGHSIKICSHPEVSSMFLAGLRWCLARRGVRLEGGPGRVALVVLCSQKSTFTFASLSYLLGGAGFMKLNSNPADWRRPEDRAALLADWNPEVISGDPISLEAWMSLGAAVRPKAVVSAGMMLLEGLRRQLEERFGCPLLDLYSMNECRLIAADFGDGHEIVAPDVYVEILDPDGRRCPDGVRGEIVLTGGRNPFLPLLRYRTGDYAALDVSGDRPRLRGLDGRMPVVFEAADGQRINSIDVTHALNPLAIPQFTLRQRRDRSLVFGVRSAGHWEGSVREALTGLFGAGIPLEIRELTPVDTASGKVRAYGRTDD